MKLSDIILLLKGKRAAVGEIRNWKGGSYIKTPTGWKPHQKEYSKKFVERKNNAAGKKEADLKHRQSEVARLSGEIQGHKASVDHHSQSGDKNDVRQAKHHAIRAQVKGRRLEKHKQILAERHGVKDEVVKPVKKKQFNFSKPLSLNSIQNNTWGKQPEKLSNDDLLKTYAYVQYANYAIKRNLINAPTGKTHILPQVGGQDNINAFENEIKKRGLENAFEIDIDLSQYRVKSQEAKANFEKWKADRQEEKPKETAVKEKKLSQRNSFLKDRYEAGHSLSDIFKELKKDYLRDPTTANAIFTDFIKSQKESGNQKLMNEFNRTSFIENIHDTPQYKEMLTRHGIDPSDPYKEKEQPKPKENVIQSGNRGATIAGQHFSKREVDILNSLDDIVKRVKSPVVQDLINKRKEANIVIPSKELGQAKLEPHESKFMELVKRNRSQADKQAGYPEERRKVEAETGVKIPKEKAVEMTKHMKASFIWDIKKPSLIR